MLEKIKNFVRNHETLMSIITIVTCLIGLISFILAWCNVWPAGIVVGNTILVIIVAIDLVNLIKNRK